MKKRSTAFLYGVEGFHFQRFAMKCGGPHDKPFNALVSVPKHDSQFQVLRPSDRSNPITISSRQMFNVGTHAPNFVQTTPSPEHALNADAEQRPNSGTPIWQTNSSPLGKQRVSRKVLVYESHAEIHCLADFGAFGEQVAPNGSVFVGS